MTEATVSAPLMKMLREMLPGAIVVKHQDRSMIGLPDCSVTWGKRPSCWLEFKLVECPKKYQDFCELEWEALARTAGQKSPVQWQFMMNAARQGLSFHVVWVRKTCVLIMDHSYESFKVLSCTAEAARFLAEFLKNESL